MAVIFPASSIGNEKSGSDTGVIGCLAVLRSDHSVKVLLSNNHVIFASEGAPPLRIGSPSAGSCRCCCPKNIVARATTPGLERDFGTTYVDCAIARLEPGMLGINQVSGLNPGNGLNGFLKGTAAASDGQRAFVCTNSETLPGRIIPCRVDRASIDINNLAGGPVLHQQIKLVVDAGFAQDPQFGSGDSGSIVVDEQNKVLGLMHMRGSSGSTMSLDFIIACPINAVMNAMLIDILPESPSSPSSGALLEDVPREEANRGISDPDLLRFQKLVKQSPRGSLYNDLGFQHGPEVVRLVHHCRPVTVAWHRSEGPAWAAHLINSARDPEYRLPEEVKGVSQQRLLTRMAEALRSHASPALRADLDQYGESVITLAGFQSVTEALNRVQGGVVRELTASEEKPGTRRGEQGHP